MRALLVVFLLLLFPLITPAQDKTLRQGEWIQVANSDGTPFVGVQMPFRAGGAIYVMYGGISNETINKYWSHLDRGVAQMVRTKDGSPFQGLKPCSACGVAVAAQQASEVPGGMRYWRITGTLAEPILGVDGKPFMLVPEYGNYEASEISGPRSDLCPYFLVRRGDRAPWLCRLDGLVAKKVDLPKEVASPRCAWTGKGLIVGGGKKGFLLGDNEPVEIKDSAGASLSTSTFQDLAFVGDYLLVNPGHALRCKLLRFDDAVASQVELPQGSSVLRLELVDGQFFALLAGQPTPGSWEYELCEFKGGKFLPTKALDAWKSYGPPTIHNVDDQCLLEYASLKAGWSLVSVAGGKARELISRPASDTSARATALTGSAPGVWLLKLDRDGSSYWRLSATGPAKELALAADVVDLVLASGDAKGFYATVQVKGDRYFLAYRLG